MLNALFRVRLAGIGLAVLLAAGASVFFPHLWPLRASLAFAAAWIAAATISFVHLRHVGLALLASVAPVPGLLIAFTAGLPQSFALAYLPGFVCAIFLAGEIAQRVATGIVRDGAAQDALGGLGLTALFAIAAAALPLGVYCFIVHAALPALSAVVSGGASAILIVSLATSLLPFSEKFITRANRVREWRERLLEHLLFVTESRWSMSISGIAMVFAVLGIFGAQNLRVAPGLLPEIAGAIAAAAIFAAVFALTRDWRGALAAVLASALTVLMALWGLARMGASLDLQSLLWLMQIWGVAAISILFIAAEPGRYLSGDRAEAMRLALLRKSTAAIFVCLAALLLLVSQAENPAVIAIQTVTLLFGLAGTLLFQPAIAAILETLIPTKAALEARYRVR